MSMLFTLCILATTTQLYEGRGILNVITIGERYKIDDVTEIQHFSAYYAEKDVGDKFIWFILEIDSNVKLGSPGNGAAPTLVLVHENVPVAAIGLRVGNLDKQIKDGGSVIEWKVSAHFDESSHCMFQLHANSNDATLVILPFAAAEGIYVDREKNETRMNFSELRSKIRGVKN